MFVTIDPYYDITFYNECKSALTNNNVSFKEFISIKTPYKWYLEVPSVPIMVNYDILPDKEQRYLVSKVIPLRPDEEYLLYRKPDSKGNTNLARFILNKPLQEAQDSKSAIFFNASSKEDILRITKELPGLRIYFLGRYYNKRYKVCLCNNSLIKNYLTPDQILVEKTKEHKELGRFEADLNYKIFKNKEKLRKYTQTPYYENGQYFAVNYKGDRTNTDLVL